MRELPAPPDGPPPRRATGICAPCGSAGPRSARPLPCCAQFDRGKRSRCSGLLAPQIKVSGYQVPEGSLDDETSKSSASNAVAARTPLHATEVLIAALSDPRENA